MNRSHRMPPPGETLEIKSVTLTTSDWAKVDAIAHHLANQLGVIPSRGRAIEHILSLVDHLGEP